MFIGLMHINLKKLKPEATIPVYAKEGDAGLDLIAISKEIDKYGNVAYGTGLAIEIPIGFVGLLFPRSSVSKYNLDLANAVGVIDSGYRGEIICKFKPTPCFVGSDQNGPTEFYETGDKIAQLIIMACPKVIFKEVDELTSSERGEGGFGSSGQ